jgi:large subunit ribosomal protein L9
MAKKIKIIFLKEVPEVGKKFEIAEVAPGYFRNYLFPNNLAELATDKALTRLEKEIEKAEKEKEARVTENKKKAEKLENQKFVFSVKVGEKNQVYGSINKEDVVEKLAEEGHKDISVNLHHSLKELGEHDVVVDFGDEVTASIKVILEKEE